MSTKDPFNFVEDLKFDDTAYSTPDLCQKGSRGDRLSTCPSKDKTRTPARCGFSDIWTRLSQGVAIWSGQYVRENPVLDICSPNERTHGEQITCPQGKGCSGMSLRQEKHDRLEWNC